MQTKIIEKEVEEKAEYPCLMIRKDQKFVVLFIYKSNGVVVHPGTSSWKLGESCQFFEMNYFTPFNGTIELSN